MSGLRALEPERPAWLVRELFPFDSRFVEVDGVRVHYVDEGRGAVLLFLPGAPTWSFFYRRFIGALRDEFRCVAVDYPGFGRSPLVQLLQEQFNLLLRYTARTFPMSAAECKVYLAPYAGRAARRNPVLLLADLAGNDAYMRDVEQALQTRLNHLPVLLMWGARDPGYEFLPRFQRIFPDAQTLTIPGAHHFPFAEAPDQMIAEIRHWWKLVSVASESTRRVS